MKNKHIIYGEDDKILSQIAKEIREGDSSSEIILRHARTFSDTDQVGHVHIVGNFPHIKAAYEALTYVDGGEEFKPEITEYDDEGQGLINQPTGPIVEAQAAPTGIVGEPGVPGVETPAAVAERGEQSTDPEPKEVTVSVAAPSDSKAKKGKK